MKKIKRHLGYRTPDIFRRKVKHKIVKDKVCAKINWYDKNKTKATNN